MNVKVVDKIDPYNKSNLRRNRRNGGSSCYSHKISVELKQLPFLNSNVHIVSSYLLYILYVIHLFNYLFYNYLFYILFINFYIWYFI